MFNQDSCRGQRHWLEILKIYVTEKCETVWLLSFRRYLNMHVHTHHIYACYSWGSKSTVNREEKSLIFLGFSFWLGIDNYFFNWKKFIQYILIMFISLYILPTSPETQFYVLFPSFFFKKTNRNQETDTHKTHTKTEAKLYKQKTILQKNAQAKQNETNKSTKKYFWICFVLANFSWAWGLPWSTSR